MKKESNLMKFALTSSLFCMVLYSELSYAVASIAEPGQLAPVAESSNSTASRPIAGVVQSVDEARFKIVLSGKEYRYSPSISITGIKNERLTVKALQQGMAVHFLLLPGRTDEIERVTIDTPLPTAQSSLRGGGRP